MRKARRPVWLEWRSEREYKEDEIRSRGMAGGLERLVGHAHDIGI